MRNIIEKQSRSVPSRNHSVWFYLQLKTHSCAFLWSLLSFLATNLTWQTQTADMELKSLWSFCLRWMNTHHKHSGRPVLLPLPEACCFRKWQHIYRDTRDVLWKKNKPRSILALESGRNRRKHRVEGQRMGGSCCRVKVTRYRCSMLPGVMAMHCGRKPTLSMCCLTFALWPPARFFFFLPPSLSYKKHPCPMVKDVIPVRAGGF